MTPTIRTQADGVLRALREAEERAQQVVHRTPNADVAFALSTEFVEAAREVTNSLAQLRAETAAQIHQAEHLSLAGLADRIGVSKSRADQLLKTAKTRKGTADDE